MKAKTGIGLQPGCRKDQRESKKLEEAQLSFGKEIYTYHKKVNKSMHDVVP